MVNIKFFRVAYVSRLALPTGFYRTFQKNPREEIMQYLAKSAIYFRDLFLYVPFMSEIMRCRSARLSLAGCCGWFNRSWLGAKR
jgi:hypothetical protein